MVYKFTGFKEKFISSLKERKPLLLAGIFILAAIGYFVYDSTFYYQMYFNGQAIGIVKEITVAEDTMLKIEEKVYKEYGENAYFEKEIDFEKVRVDKKQLIEQEQLESTLLASLEVFKEAAIITVDGEEQLVLNSEEEANSVLDTIKNTFIEKLQTTQEPFEVIDIAFNQDVQIVTKDVLEDSILTKEEAVNIINTSKSQVQTYNVVSGDNAWNISRAYQTDIGTLQQANSDKNIEKLMPGDTINLVVEDEFLDVAITIKKTVVEEIDFPVEKLKDSSLYIGESKVQQEGTKGQKEVTKEVSYVNGTISGEKILTEKVLVEPVKKIVLEGSKKRPSTSRGSRGVAPTYNGEIGSSIVATAKHYIGVPYRRGGSTPAGFDCSGFTKFVYAQYGINIPRTSGGQASAGGYVARGDLRPGDIVAFTGHVGIYIGGNQFIHSPSTGKSVMISSLNQAYWRARYKSGRRVY